ncbi:hypothetical protein [Oenococcus oeni]|uniref:hypothetical protein n=1 Tax=Oenococcus oeni TaxID=1247 RepID=UPI0019553B2B|nr:hypothetical protein [Oenococcus oeni]
MKKRVNKKKESEADFQYRCARQNLKMEDLKRYGIQAVLLDSYDQITDLLKQVEQISLSRSVFISGSASVFTDPWPENKISALAYSMGRKLVQNNYRIVSGFGLGIGSSIINGSLSEIMQSKFKHTDEYLTLRPFPQMPASEDRNTLWEKYRYDMIGESGICIFMFGNKLDKDSHRKVIADGALKEFEIAQKLHKAIIPIGSTGDAAQQILASIEKNMQSYPYLKEYVSKLSTSVDVNELTDIVLNIIQNYSESLSK